MGLDKTAQGYQEEDIIKLLKDIRDGLAVGITPGAPGAPDLDTPDDNDDYDDDNDDDDDDNNMPDLETEEEATKTNILNKFNNKINNFDEMVKIKLNNDVKKLKAGGGIDKLKEIQEKFDYQYFKVIELKSELDKKNKNIKALEDNVEDLKNEKLEMIDEKNKLKKINNTNNKKIQKLEEKIEEDENYFNNYEENRIELEKKN